VEADTVIDMNDSALDKPADIRTIRKLHQEGLLTDEAFSASLKILQPASSWFSWAERNLLFFGSALILSGIIFFFAYNWSAMGKFFKLGLIEAGIAACAIGSYFLGLNRLTGRILLLSASVLLGVLMAVYGQTYQTGADAFELFTGWAVLISGWVVVSEFAALWLIWLILINTGTILYWVQVIEPAHAERLEFLYVILAALNGAALAFRELGIKRGFKWLEGRWLRCILLTAILIALSISPITLIFDHIHFKDTTALSALAWPVVALGGYLCYRHILPDMISLALIIMNVCLILLSYIGQLMLDHSGYGNAFMFLLFALIIIGVVSAAAFWLKKVAVSMAKEAAK